MTSTAKSELLPVFLTVSLVMTTMYLFNPDTIYLLGAAAFVLCAALFYFFRYIRTLKKAAPLIYISTLLIVLFISLQVIKNSDSSDKLGLIEFIYLPYEVGIRSSLYSSYIFLIACYFFSSFIYYFTSVVYRQSVVFMIILIPCGVYAKKFEVLPFPLLVIMSALYICVMIHYKQLYLSKKIKVVMDSSYKKSLGLFVLVTIIAAVIIPKPELTPFSKVIDGLSDKWLMPGVETGNYSEHSLDNEFGKSQSNRILFFVDANETLYLKKQVFDLYEGSHWAVLTKDNFDWGHSDWEEAAIYDNSALFIENVAAAAEADKDFASQYGVDGYSVDYSIPSPKESASIIGYDFSVYCYLTPLGTYYLSKENTYKTQNGEIFGDDKIDLSRGSYYLQYYSQQQSCESLSDFSRNFNFEGYYDFLCDLKSVIKNNQLDSGESYQALLFEISEYENALSYYENTYQLYSSRLRSLALDITSGCESDFEKALTIQNYFSDNDFEYSLSYVPPTGSEGAEYFVFSSKKGSCSDYASAMVLMAREAGLPARYTEGFVVQEKGDDGNYIVRELNAHAYPEVYISGMGWTVFEPTVSSNSAAEKNDEDNTHLTSKNITTAVLILFGIAVLLYILLSSRLKELGFRIRLSFKGRRKNAVLFLKIRQLAAKRRSLKPETLSVKETASIIREDFGIDISAFAKSYERMCYKDEKLSDKGFCENYRLYKSVYTALKKREARC